MTLKPLVYVLGMGQNNRLEATCQDADHRVLEEQKGLDGMGSCYFKLDSVWTRADGVEGSRSEIGGFYFTAMPGCCGIVVSHGTFLREGYRHTSLSEPFRTLKTALARALGYTVMFMTTDMAQPASVGNAIKSKYKIVQTFTNKRTQNTIGMGFKVL